jgi:hypothetical protein
MPKNVTSQINISSKMNLVIVQGVSYIPSCPFGWVHFATDKLKMYDEK